jgi:hypothetical protein
MGADSDNDQPLADLMAGFSGYHRPTESELKTAYTGGVVALDTSALLDIYRLLPTARKELIGLLYQLRDRLFVPYHVAWEFHQRRVQACADRVAELGSEITELDKLASQCRELVNRVSQRAHGRHSEASLAKEALNAAFEKAKGLIQLVSADYDLKPDELVVGKDPVLPELTRLLGGRVGQRPDEETLLSDTQEGERRITKQVPPGYKDHAKSGNKTGDYLWWVEVIRYARSHTAETVLIVTNDVAKGDWTYDVRGFRVGADPRLVDEMKEKAGKRLVLATVSDLLRDAPRYLQATNVSKETVAEATNLEAQELLKTAEHNRRQFLNRASYETIHLAKSEFDLLLDAVRESARHTLRMFGADQALLMMWKDEWNATSDEELRTLLQKRIDSQERKLRATEVGISRLEELERIMLMEASLGYTDHLNAISVPSHLMHDLQLLLSEAGITK